MFNLHIGRAVSHVSSTVKNAARSVERAVAKPSHTAPPAQPTHTRAQVNEALHNVARQVNLKGTPADGGPLIARSLEYPQGYCPPTGPLTMEDRPRASAYNPDPERDARQERFRRFVDPYYDHQRRVEEAKHGHAHHGSTHHHLPEEPYPRHPVIPRFGPRVAGR